jgi:nucleoside 2-deoxyribosyltransferase
MNRIYLIGSLRNPEIPRIGNYLREIGFEVFDDWFAGGKIADDEWQAYEQSRGRPYDVALGGYAAQHVYNFDLEHINSSNIGVLAMPAGKSGHLELGYMIGKGKPGYVLFDKEPERWDVMYNFADGVFFDVKELGRHLMEMHR